MPELITHAATGYLSKPFTAKWWPLIVLGTILPDLLSRPVAFISSMCTTCSYAVYAAHSPAYLLTITLLISLLFEGSTRFKVWMALFGGTLLHIGADALQRHIGDLTIPWLFPFSIQGYELGLFWSDISPVLTPFALLLILIVWRATKSSPTP